MPLTNPSAIPAGKRAAVKAVVQRIGPQVLGDRYPTDEAGQPRTDLTAAEVGDVFEAVTREFWRQQLEADAAERAADQARRAAIAEHAADPFGD